MLKDVDTGKSNDCNTRSIKTLSFQMTEISLFSFVIATRFRGGNPVRLLSFDKRAIADYIKVK